MFYVAVKYKNQRKPFLSFFELEGKSTKKDEFEVAEYAVFKKDPAEISKARYHKEITSSKEDDEIDSDSHVSSWRIIP